MIPFICEMSRVGKFIEIENWGCAEEGMSLGFPPGVMKMSGTRQ